MADDEKPIQLRMKRRIVDPDRSPETVHRFVWTRFGSDIVLEVGFIDLSEINALIERAKAGEPPGQPELTITHRLALTPQLAVDLAREMNRLVDDLKKNKLIPEGEG